MGLDIYLYKLTKPRLKKSKTYTEDELSKYETSLVEENDLDDNFIKIFTQTINVDSSHWDYEKLYEIENQIRNIVDTIKPIDAEKLQELVIQHYKNV